METEKGGGGRPRCRYCMYLYAGYRRRGDFGDLKTKHGWKIESYNIEEICTNKHN